MGKKIFIFLFIGLFAIVFSGCENGDKRGSLKTADIANVDIVGIAAKGPFAKGSIVTAYKLDKNGHRSKTDIRKTKIIDNIGHYKLSNISWHGATEIVVSGSYFDEHTSSGSTNSLSLSAVTALNNKATVPVNVNVFTDLSSQYVKHMLKNNSVANIDIAKKRARDTIVKSFDLSISPNAKLEDLNLLDGKKNTSANAELLRVSTAITMNPNMLFGLREGFKDGDINNDPKGKGVFASLGYFANKVDLSKIADSLIKHGFTNKAPSASSLNTKASYIIHNKYAIFLPPILKKINDIVITKDTNDIDLRLSTKYRGVNLTYSAKSSDTNIATVSVKGNILTIHIISNVNGEAEITVYVTNGIFTDMTKFKIIINLLNHAPVAYDQNISTDEDVSKAITLSAQDKDNKDTLSYTITKNPQHGKLSGTAPNLIYTPDINFNGNDNFKFKADDGTTDSNIATVNIAVKAVNDAPTAYAGEDQNISENSSVTLHCTGSDIEGAVTYKWLEGTTELATTQNYTTPALSIGTHTYTCVVTDSDGAMTSDSVDIIVFDPVLYITAEGGNGDYICDGAEDQIKINEALDRVRKNDYLTTVYLKGPVRCIIDEPILISSHTKLLGDSNALVKLEDHQGWNTPNKPLIGQKNDDGTIAWQEGGEGAISDIEIAGFELSGGIQDEDTGKYFVILVNLYDPSYAKIHDMNLHDSRGDIIRFYGSNRGKAHHIDVYNNKIIRSGHEGIYFIYPDHIKVYNNEIYHTRTNTGIRVSKGSNFSIYDNIIGNSLNKTPSGYAGILIDSSNGTPIGKAEIYDNYIYGKNGGIVLEGGKNIDSKDSLKNVHIHHNRLYRINNYDDDSHLNGAIRIKGFHNTLVEHNTIEKSEKDGIVYDEYDGTEDVGTGYQTIVRNNIITNCKGYGINNLNPNIHTFISENNDLFNNGIENGNSNNYNNTSSSSDIHADPLYASDGWTHIVTTYDSTTERFKIYVNGRERANKHFSGFGNIGTNNYKISVGAYLKKYYGLTGKLDDMAVWDRALSDGEIRELWNNGNGKDINGTSLTDMLKGYWKMENNWNNEVATQSNIKSTASFSQASKLGSYSGLFKRTTYVLLPKNFYPTSALTISTWVNVKNNPSERATIFNKGSQGKNNHIWLYVANGYVYFELGNGTIRENISAPIALDPKTDLDLHLKSQYGRWDEQSWVTDSKTSPAIDQGKPSSDYSNEPYPNGGRANLGAYGNTNEASKSRH